MLCYVIYAYVKSKYLDYTVIFKPYSNHRFTCYAGQQRLHGIMSDSIMRSPQRVNHNLFIVNPLP